MDGHLLADAVPVLPDTPASQSTTRTGGSAWLFPLFAVAAGGLDGLLLLGWHEIDPTNLAWIRRDPAVYQAGWEFLRRQPWSFPPTWLAHLDYPFGISAAYLDVIPIIAVPLHLFGEFLPQNFQYLGLWAVLCLILQTYFALKLLSRFTSDRIVLCLGALFFLDAPILLNRLYGHFSLCSQWLILAAFYYYFRPLERTGVARYMAPFAVLAAIAGGITPYMAVMVVVIGFAAALNVSLGRTVLGRSRSAPGATLDRVVPLAWCIAVVGATAVSLFVFGFGVPGQGPALPAPGYGTFSLNLLSPISPLGRALLFGPLPLLPGQEIEGYAYFGAGLVALGLVALVLRPARAAALTAAPTLRPLVWLSIILTLFALSLRISLGPNVLAVVPVPAGAFHLLSIFRSSGRFFWPVWYLLLLAAIVGASSVLQIRFATRVLLAAGLLLQIADTSNFTAALARTTRITATNPLHSAAWGKLGAGVRHLAIVPAQQCDTSGTTGMRADWYWFARLAARDDLTLNSVYAARSSARSYLRNCVDLPRRIASGVFAKDTVYILDGNLARLATANSRALRCRVLDGYHVCTANAQYTRDVHGP